VKAARNLSLLLLLLLQSGGMLLIYEMQRAWVQNEMQQLITLSDTRFETIVLPIAEYEKSKINDREILLNGMFYDVKSISICGSRVELLAVHDAEEKSIMEKIMKEIGSGSRHKTPFPTALVNLLTLVYTHPSMPAHFYAAHSCPLIFPPLGRNYSSAPFEVSSPPPESRL